MDSDMKKKFKNGLLAVFVSGLLALLLRLIYKDIARFDTAREITIELSLWIGVLVFSALVVYILTKTTK